MDTMKYITLRSKIIRRQKKTNLVFGIANNHDEKSGCGFGFENC